MTHHTTDPDADRQGPSTTPSAYAAPTAQQLAQHVQQKAIRMRRQRQQRLARATASAPGSHPATLVFSASQRQGRQAESRALSYLRAAGLVPLARNLACKAGEIDLVCLDGDTLVFIEVRARQDTRFGGAAASIGPSKQRRLIQTAQYWLPRLCQRHFGGRLPPCRFDAVTLEGASIHWIRHAFTL